MTLKEVLESLKELDAQGKISLKNVVIVTKDAVIVAKKGERTSQ